MRNPGSRRRITKALLLAVSAVTLTVAAPLLSASGEEPVTATTIEITDAVSASVDAPVTTIEIGEATSQVAVTTIEITDAVSAVETSTASSPSTSSAAVTSTVAGTSSWVAGTSSQVAVDWSTPRTPTLAATGVPVTVVIVTGVVLLLLGAILLVVTFPGGMTASGRRTFGRRGIRAESSRARTAGG